MKECGSSERVSEWPFYHFIIYQLIISKIMELDTLYIKTIKSDGQHNYISEIEHVKAEEEVAHNAQRMTSGIAETFYDFFTSSVGKAISYSFLVFLLGVIIYSICQHFSFFEVNVKSEAKGMANDTIYGHEWDKELSALMAKGDYSEAVVLCYLHLIDMLDGRKVITFMVSKTPQMFLDEAKAYTSPSGDTTIRETICPALQTLTNHYLQIRYGHRKASEALAKELIEQDAALLASLSNQQ